jgi:hypothetical protein
MQKKANVKEILEGRQFSYKPQCKDSVWQIISHIPISPHIQIAFHVLCSIDFAEFYIDTHHKIILSHNP